MYMKCFVPFAGVLLAGVALAQSTTGDGLAARRLFYQDNQPEVVFRATSVATRPADSTSAQVAQVKPSAETPSTPAMPARPKPPAVPAAKQQAVRRQQLAQAQENKLPDGTKVDRPKNCGVRYNLVKVAGDPSTRTPVPSDTNFKKGDCVAVQIQPNRGGLLYVFNQGSSGKWQPLLPSVEMSDEPNTVKAFQQISIPAQYCFEMDDPAGEERLFVMITEKEQDVKNLDDILRMMNENGGSKEMPSPKRGDTMVLAQNRLAGTLNGFERQLASRDIKVTRVNNPVSKDEPAYSVYLVNASASANDNLILEVKLSHK